jgi:hypothetical protein
MDTASREMRNDEELQDAGLDDLDEADESTSPSLEDLAALMTVPDQLKPPSAKPFRPAACHPDRSVYGSGPLCRKCSDLVRWQGERGKAKVRSYVDSNSGLSAAMRADVEEWLGKMQAYAPRRKKPTYPDSKSIRTSNPKVAEHAAKVLIMNALDGESAAKELKPDLAPADQAVLGKKLETDPRIHREVEKQLTPRGLSDHDRDYFVTRLWEMFESNDPREEQKALSAMRILGKAFISEKVENTQVEMLKIAGVSEGVARMMGEAEDVQSAQSAASPFDSAGAELNIKEEPFDE